MTKHENGVLNVLDIVKDRLRRIANSIDLEELKEQSCRSKNGVLRKKVKPFGLKVPFYFSRLPE